MKVKFKNVRMKMNNVHEEHDGGYSLLLLLNKWHFITTYSSKSTYSKEWVWFFFDSAFNIYIYILGSCQAKQELRNQINVNVSLCISNDWALMCFHKSHPPWKTCYRRNSTLRNYFLCEREQRDIFSRSGSR